MLMPSRTTSRILWGALLVSSMAFSGCRLQSGDSVVRRVGMNVSGVYAGPNGRSLVARNSGNSIQTMNVIQNGDRLEGVDNNGMVFRGRIGSVSGDPQTRASATFNLKGQTTTGVEGVMSGTFVVEGTTSTMSGTWAEPNQYSTFRGTAAVDPPPDPDPDPDPTPDPNNNNNDNNGNG